MHTYTHQPHGISSQTVKYTKVDSYIITRVCTAYQSHGLRGPFELECD